MKRLLSYLLLTLIALSTATISGQDFPATPAAPPAAGALPGAAAAPSASFSPTRMIEMIPQQKRGLLIEGGERNPYAKRAPEEEKDLTENESDEESQIRAKLTSLKVTGRSQGPKGLRLLLGDIIVEAGRQLPQLLLTQVENLKVIEVTPEAIVLGWIDNKTGELTGKGLQVLYDLNPNVTYALHGQTGGTSEDGTTPAARSMGVLRVARGTDTAGASTEEGTATASDTPSSDLPANSAVGTQASVSESLVPETRIVPLEQP